MSYSNNSGEGEAYTFGGDTQWAAGQYIAANGTLGNFQPFLLFAGECDVVTTDETIGQLGLIAPYTVMGRRADGVLVPVVEAGLSGATSIPATGTITFSAQPAIGDSVTIAGNAIAFAAAPAEATGTLTFTANPAVGDTVTIAGQQFQFIAVGANPVGNQMPIGLAAANTAQELANFLQANASAYGFTTTYTPGATELFFTANQVGTAGNAITLVSGSSGITVSGATFTGGVNAPLPNQVALGATDAGTAENLAYYIGQEAGAPVSAEYNGDSAPLVVTLIANTPGTAGNSITLAKSSTAIAVSGATLTGGAAGTGALPESKIVAITATGIDTTTGDQQGPVYLDGVFNHQALNWPPFLATLAQRKAATDGCRFSVKALK